MSAITVLRGGSSAGSYDVFISHSSADLEIATTACRYLRSTGLNVFLAAECLQKTGKARFIGGLNTALERSRHMLVIAPKFSGSMWQEFEWGAYMNALAMGRKHGNLVTLLVPGHEIPILLLNFQFILLDDEALPRLLPYFNR